MKRISFLFFTLLFAVFASGCSIDDFLDSGEQVDSVPRFWSGYTWTEISEDKAKELWKSFDTSTPPSSELSMYSMRKGKIWKYGGCSINRTNGWTHNGAPSWECTVENASMTLNDYPVWDRTSSGEIRKIFQANEDSSLLKFEDSDTTDSRDSHILHVIHAGWLVEYENEGIIHEVYVYEGN